MIISEQDLICLVNEMGSALFKASKELHKYYPDGKNDAMHAITNILLSRMHKSFLHTYCNEKEQKNTRLIATAPELLEACEAAYMQERCVCEEAELKDNTCLACYLESVIKKAKGY